MENSEQDFTAALARGEQIRQGGYAVAVDHDAPQRRLAGELSNGVPVMVPLRPLKGLAEARTAIWPRST